MQAARWLRKSDNGLCGHAAIGKPRRMAPQFFRFEPCLYRYRSIERDTSSTGINPARMMMIAGTEALSISAREASS